MSQEVVKYQEITAEELMALTGQSTGPRQDFPRLSIVSPSAAAEQGLPAGQFAVSQGGISVFGKPVSFRPFINAYQYSVYDTEAKLTTNRSIIIKSFADEAIDEQGTVACGKLPFKKRQNLTEAQLAEQKKITCYRVLYGLVSFKGKAATGEVTEIDALPVKLRLRGDNFMDIQTPLDQLAKKKILMLSSNLTLDNELRKNGTNVWYHLTAKADFKNLVKITDADWEHLRAFQESIDNENKTIIEKHKQSAKHAAPVTDEAEVIKQLDAEFDDTAALEAIGR